MLRGDKGESGERAVAVVAKERARVRRREARMMGELGWF